MLVAGGYPGVYAKGDLISDLDKVTGSIIFHSGTGFSDNNLVTNGGRVLAVSSMGKDFREALNLSYQNAARIQYKNKYFRTDLGYDL
jgi:phosphoribosylamine---glycine ligase